jgi:NAD(P)-dependent dehydrogenase (short-subunit alcohol dehydrogenase family)
MTESKDSKIITGMDRRDFFTGAAGLAATALVAGRAEAGAHAMAPIELTEEDKLAKQVGEGAQILVTGANRGLGLEFTRQYAERGCKVIATARTPESADELNALAAGNKNIIVEQLDVTDHARIEELGLKYKETPIDLLLNNAGIGGGLENQMFGRMNYEVFHKVMDVNVAGPMKMCEVFYRNVGASNLKKIVTVSSSQGSISGVKSPMLYWYRSSKSALNMNMVNLSFQLRKKKIIVGLVTPGATATDFIPEQFRKAIKGIQTPEQATKDMIRNIDRFSVANTGTFFDYTGDVVAW